MRFYWVSPLGDFLELEILKFVKSLKLECKMTFQHPEERARAQARDNGRIEIEMVGLNEERRGELRTYPVGRGVLESPRNPSSSSSSFPSQLKKQREWIVNCRREKMTRRRKRMKNEKKKKQ